MWYHLPQRRTSFVIGEVVLVRSHRSMAARSYVCPSAATTGSRMHMCVIGHTKCRGSVSSLFSGRLAGSIVASVDFIGDDDGDDGVCRRRPPASAAALRRDGDGDGASDAMTSAVVLEGMAMFSKMVVSSDARSCALRWLRRRSCRTQLASSNVNSAPTLPTPTLPARRRRRGGEAAEFAAAVAVVVAGAGANVVVAAVVVVAAAVARMRTPSSRFGNAEIVARGILE